MHQSAQSDAHIGEMLIESSKLQLRETLLTWTIRQNNVCMPMLLPSSPFHPPSASVLCWERTAWADNLTVPFKVQSAFSSLASFALHRSTCCCLIKLFLTLYHSFHPPQKVSVTEHIPVFCLLMSWLHSLVHTLPPPPPMYDQKHTASVETVP